MTKQISGAFLGTLAAGALIVGGTRLLGPIPLSISQTTTNKQATFDVSGEGQVTTSPDRAEVTLGVQANESTVQQAQEKGNQAIQKITNDLVTMGIAKDDIKTINYNLYPNYDYREGQRITGYALNVNLQIKMKDFEKVNQAIDSATRNGANQIGGVQFTLSDEKKLEVENQVREEAIKRAKEKATSLANLSGVKLGKIVNVVENTGNQGIYPMYAKDAAMSAAPAGLGGGAGVPSDVQPGSTTFSMTVTLSYETL